MNDEYEYFLKSAWETIWTKVTKDQFIKAERAAGFRPSIPSWNPNYSTTVATGGFSGGGFSGMVKRLK